MAMAVAMAMAIAAVAKAALWRVIIRRAGLVSGICFCALRGVTGTILLAGEATTPPNLYPPPN